MAFSNGKLSLVMFRDLVDDASEIVLRELMSGFRLDAEVQVLTDPRVEIQYLDPRLVKCINLYKMHPLAVPTQSVISDGLSAILHVARGGLHRYQCVGHLLTNAFELPHMTAAQALVSPGFNLLSQVTVDNLRKGMKHGRI